MSTFLTGFLKEASVSELLICAYLVWIIIITGPICNVHVQYRPWALQNYTHVSCVEICHVAHKFHKKNKCETLVKKYTRKDTRGKYMQIRKICETNLCPTGGCIYPGNQKTV